MANEERVTEFLKELTKLSIKHGLFIDGCGCCGSPYICDIETGEEVYDKFEFRNNEYN